MKLKRVLLKLFFIGVGLAVIALAVLLVSSTQAVHAQAPLPVYQGIVSSGRSYTCALKQDGTVACWGDNTAGQLNIPDGLSSVTQVSGNGLHTCAVKQDGTVACWGDNYYGQLNIPDGLSSVTQVSGNGFYTCALKQDGTVTCWGRDFHGQSAFPDGLSSVIQVSTGFFYTCVLKQDGTVACMGDNTADQSTVPDGLYSVTQISAGNWHACAVKQDGTLVCWGDNGSGQLNIPDGLSSVTQVSAGLWHTCVLKQDGTVACWGDNYYGQSTVPDGLSSVTQVSAGDWHTCALKQDGTVVCWGDNNYGQLDVPPGPFGPYKPDTTPPVVRLTGVRNGMKYILGAVPQAGCLTRDSESGVRTDATLQVTGGASLGVGVFTATCSGAVDKAGNPASPTSVQYTVTFLYSGFLSPVENGNVLNVARAGQTIPFKWRITDAHRNPIANLTSVTVTAAPLSCAVTKRSSAIKGYAVGNLGLQNLGNGYYQYNWKTPSTYANSCKTLQLDMGEGILRTAMFQFKK